MLQTVTKKKLEVFLEKRSKLIWLYLWVFAPKAVSCYAMDAHYYKTVFDNFKNFQLDRFKYPLYE